MKVVIEPLDFVTKRITATVDVDTCTKTRENVLKTLKARINLPGFRKGKVPTNILERRFPDYIKEELERLLLEEVLKHLKNVEHIETAAILKMDCQIDSSNQTVFSLEIEVVPTFTLPNYKTFPLEEDKNEVSEEEINDFIEHLRKQQATYEVVDRAAQTSDYVKVSYEGFYNDQSLDAFDQLPPLWRKQRSTWEEIGSSIANIPGLTEGISGMEVGDKKDIEVRFPKDFLVEELRDKKGHYVVELQEVREVKLPPLDEKFFKSLQLKTEADLRDFAQKSLKERKHQEYATQQKQRIADFLLQSIQCDLPNSWVKNETDRVLQEMVDLFSSHGVNNSMLEDQKEAVVQKAQSIAKDRIKLNLCFEKIAEQEKLKLENRDFEPIIVQESMRRQITPQKMLQLIRNDRRLRDDIQSKAMQAKIINWLFYTLENQQKTSAKKESVQK